MCSDADLDKLGEPASDTSVARPSRLLAAHLTPFQLYRQFRETLGFVIGHPTNRGRTIQALLRLTGWQLWKRLTGRSLVWRYWGDVKVRVYPDSRSGALAIYTGLPEYDDMLFVARILRPGDLFVDVGANIGLYSLLAAKVVGPSGKVIAFEPHPLAAKRLRENAALNGLTNVEVHEAGAGASSGRTFITADLDTVNHIAPLGGSGTLETRIEPLDAVLGTRRATVVKIDAEGFEFEVLRGARRVLREKRVDALVVELRQHGTQYGADDAAVLDELSQSGYRAFLYDAVRCRLLSLADVPHGEWNAIFIDDVPSVESRLVGP